MAYKLLVIISSNAVGANGSTGTFPRGTIRCVSRREKERGGIKQGELKEGIFVAKEKKREGVTWYRSARTLIDHLFSFYSPSFSSATKQGRKEEPHRREP